MPIRRAYVRLGVERIMHSPEEGTARREPIESSSASTFRRILVPINLRTPSHRAVRIAAELHRQFDADVCVFYAVHSDANDQFLAGLGSSIGRRDMLDEGRDELRQFVRDVAPAEADAIECDANLEENTVEAIRTKVHEWGATLLVLSPEAHPSLLRTHSEKLMKSLAVPVLLLEPPAPNP
jgi:nucleotide-binding universal stress UspA family protein